MKIMVDAGHRNNANDYGACGNGYKESALALAIALKLKKELENNGHVVALTRSSEADVISINQRTAKAKSVHCDWFISIHINAAASNDANGVEVCYKSQKPMAEKISREIAIAAGLRDRGAKSREDLGVLNRFDKAVLVECGFITNPTESDFIARSDTQDKIARAITRAFQEMHRLPIAISFEDQVKKTYNFDENTMAYLRSYKHSNDLMKALLSKKQLSEETRAFILKYKFGAAIISRIYG